MPFIDMCMVVYESNGQIIAWVKGYTSIKICSITEEWQSYANAVQCSCIINMHIGVLKHRETNIDIILDGNM